VHPGRCEEEGNLHNLSAPASAIAAGQRMLLMVMVMVCSLERLEADMSVV
jgi:hypothetical protein